MKRLFFMLLCGCAAPATPSFDRLAMLSDAALIISANHSDLLAKAQALALSVKTDSAPAAQQKWNAAYAAFKRTEVHGFGPASDLSLATAIGSWPTAATGTLDADAAAVHTTQQVEQLGSSRKGLPALEYALWDSRFEQRRAYASALAESVVAAAAKLQDAWSQGYGDGYRRGTDPFRSVKESIDVSYNRMMSTAEALAGMRLNGPLGSKSGGTAQPDAVESRYSGLSVAHALATLQGMQTFYSGVDGQQGIGAIVQARDAALHQRMLDAFSSANAALGALQDPLASLLVSNPAQVSSAATAVIAIRDLVGTEVANAIGVTVTYSDNDGD